MSLNFKMSANDIKRYKLAIFLALFMTSGMLYGCIKNGMDHDDIMLRFREKQAVTMMSGLYLGATAMTSLCIYLVKRRAGEKFIPALFWLLCALGFFFLCMDEYFMIHEGIDEAVGQLIWHKDIHELNLDNMVILAYGILAAGICFYYRNAVLSHPIMIPSLALGALFLGGTIVFHCLERIHMAYEVAEESSKMMGVIFFFVAYYLALLSSLDRLKLAQDQGGA